MTSAAPANSVTVLHTATRLIRKAGLAGQVTGIQAFRDAEYDKFYSTWRVRTSVGHSYVLKRAGLLPELYSYQKVFCNGDPVPLLYQHEIADPSSCWLLMEDVGETDIRSLGLQPHLTAAGALACFHANHWGQGQATYAQLEDRQAEYHENRAYLETHLARTGDPDIEQLGSVHRRIFDRLSTSRTTVIHGDLLSMNMIYDGHGVRLIDWGATMIGHPAMDLGRWLGDLRHAGTGGWIPPQWERPILEAYYERLQERLGRGWNTWEGMREEYEWGKRLNYFDVLFSHIRNGWAKDRWYDANLAALYGGLGSRTAEA
jgi:hypothetical protein